MQLQTDWTEQIKLLEICQSYLIHLWTETWSKNRHLQSLHVWPPCEYIKRKKKSITLFINIFISPFQSAWLI